MKQTKKIAKVEAILTSLKKHLTITELPNERELKTHTYVRSFSQVPPDPIPKIALSGYWLRDTGFDCGTMVRVIPSNGIIVICCK